MLEFLLLFLLVLISFLLLFILIISFSVLRELLEIKDFILSSAPKGDTEIIIDYLNSKDIEKDKGDYSWQK